MGFLCFLLFCVGALLVVFSGKQKKREFAGLLLIAVCFFAYGLSSLHKRALIKATDHPSVSGQILTYKITGRGGVSSLVSVRSDAGTRYRFHLDSTLPGVEPGDRVTFKYVEATGGVRELRVLNGKAIGTIVGDEDEDFYPYFWLLCGVVFSGVSLLSFVMRKRRQARPQ